MVYKHNLAIFCKTCIRDIECLKQLLKSIKDFNKDNIPVCVSIARNEENVLTPIINSYDKNIKIFIDEDITSYNYNNDDILLKDWIPQQFVKLELYKTNFARHYLIIDSDCYFIKDFYIKDFLYDKDIPYIPVSDYYKAEKFAFQLLQNPPIVDKERVISNFLNRNGKPVYMDMPWILTSEYMKMFENYLTEKNTNFKDIILLLPFEMQWYLEFVLSKNLPYVPCSTLFFVMHLETQYQIYRWLGFDEEIIKREYLGICMNKGYVKSTKFKPLWIGSHIIRNLIRLNYKMTKGRYDYKKETNLSFWQNIFSITNEYKNKVKTHKVYTFLGLRFKRRINRNIKV